MQNTPLKSTDKLDKKKARNSILVYSPDIKLILKELCVIIDIGFRTPPEHVVHHWLSVYDCKKVNVPLIDVLRVLYVYDELTEVIRSHSKFHGLLYEI